MPWHVSRFVAEKWIFHYLRYDFCVKPLGIRTMWHLWHGSSQLSTLIRLLQKNRKRHSTFYHLNNSICKFYSYTDKNVFVNMLQRCEFRFETRLKENTNFLVVLEMNLVKLLAQHLTICVMFKDN